MRRKLTIQDIAHRAGVAPATVSRVLNDHPNVRARTRARVLAVIQELDYRPSFAAKHMRTHRSRLIGFLSDEVATTPYAGNIILGAQDAAWEQGHILLVVNVANNPELMHSVIETFLEREVEGIVYAAMYHRGIELPENVLSVPVVMANCFATNYGVSSVVPDEFSGGYAATELLLKRGHHRIGFINVNTLKPGIPASIGRWQGYRAALEDNGIAYDEALVRYGFGASQDGYRYTWDLMQLPDPPTAVFCGNDRTALGAYNALYELGLRIPDDIAVVGFDNQEIIAGALRPTLTTMQLPHYEMGRMAAGLLLEDILNRDGRNPRHERIACTVVTGEST